MGEKNNVSKGEDVYNEYETVIGLEVHVELATRTKIFCGCSTAFGGEPNTHTCPVCTGMPGALPVLNRKVVEHAIAVGLATHCTISKVCRFDRKNYFYPDNPQNYQISQLYIPICRDGYVEIPAQDDKQSVKRIGIHEIHMEEDAGKLIHDPNGKSSYVDYNRSGVLLIEIVSEPDMRSAKEVIAYLEKLRLIIQYLGASDCKLQEGSMRADINLSVRKHGSRMLGTRTEMKNLNSFHAITETIAHERRRQIDLLEAGREVEMETRRWDENKKTSFSMRTKEDSKDYRYFPDPDLPPVYISEEWIHQVLAGQPEFREKKQVRYKEMYDLPDYDIEILTGDKHLADLFEAATELCKQPKQVSNWLMGETMRLLKEHNMSPDEIRFSADNLAKLILMTEKKEINLTIAKEVFEQIFEWNIDPVTYVAEHGLCTVSDDQALHDAVNAVIKSNPQSVNDYLGGKEKALGFLVGQTMKYMKGRAEPGLVNRILREQLSKE